MSSVVSTVEETNFKIFYLFYIFVYRAFILMISLILFSPAIAAVVGGFILVIHPNDVLKTIFDPSFVDTLRHNVTVVLGIMSGVLIFLTNASATFSRMQLEDQDAKHFREAAYGFMLATILIFLSLAIYFIYSLKVVKLSQVYSDNILTLFLSFIAIASVSFAFGISSIASVYFGIFLTRIRKSKIQRESFMPINDIGRLTLLTSVAFWCTLWIFLAAVLSIVIKSCITLNFVIVLISLATMLGSIHQYAVIDVPEPRLRLIMTVVLIVLLLTNQTLWR